MSLQQVITTRYSCRAYRHDPVPAPVVERVLEAMRLAPTACNRQPFRLYVLDTKRHRDSLSRIYHQPWLLDAPLVVGMVALTRVAWSRRDKVNYAVVDATIALDHLILAATEEGLGTCWIAAFDPSAARETLSLQPDEEPVAFTPLGYPADRPPTKQRKPLGELVVYPDVR